MNTIQIRNADRELVTVDLDKLDYDQIQDLVEDMEGQQKTLEEGISFIVKAAPNLTSPEDIKDFQARLSRMQFARSKLVTNRQIIAKYLYENYEEEEA